MFNRKYRSKVMKNKYFSLFVLVFSSLLVLTSCEGREGIEEPIRLLDLYVVDTAGLPVPNAKVDFFLNENDLMKDQNPIMKSFYSDKEGRVQVALDFKIFDYYVNIEKEDLNNWYTTTIVKTPNLLIENVNTVTIKNSIQAQLTGRYEKRWQQTAHIINGNPSNLNCFNQLYHNFIRRSEVTSEEDIDGRIQKFQSNVCTSPEKPAGFNVWKYNQEDNTMVLGLGTSQELYKFEDFTGDKFSIVLTTLDGTFIIERKFKLVQ